MKKLINFSQGLTLIELLIVMAIIGILATIGFGQYTTSQLKARDAQRKGDLDNIARALEMYYNDHQQYPLSYPEYSGKIVIPSGSTGSDQPINWGEEFSTAEVIYMKTLPQEPSANYDYCYQSDENGTYYRLFSILENTNDKDYCHECYECNTENYDYGITSPNVSLSEIESID